MTDIDKNQLERMIEADAVTVVEVLGRNSYCDFHLPGAVNVPFDEDFVVSIRARFPDKHEPLVVYCWDDYCHNSRNAAQKLHELGYHRVYDYVGGKTDWRAAGNPIEAGGVGAPGDFVRVAAS